MGELPINDVTGQIVDAAMKVHTRIGSRACLSRRMKSAFCSNCINEDFGRSTRFRFRSYMSRFKLMRAIASTYWLRTL